MADNQFSGRPGESDSVDIHAFLIRTLREEFPNDTLLQQGILAPNERPEFKPVTDIATRNVASGLLEIDADVSASYGEYTLSKLLPGLDEEQLDDALDDEFVTYVVDEPAGALPIPVVSGLFFITTTRPGDYHDMYINYGPEQITSMLASGMSEDEVRRNIFCVWYVERNKARPIPNYKTLEVMLVERNLSYDSISVAETEDIKRYDLELDGRFSEYSSLDEDGNDLPVPTFVDEFAVRSILNRSNEWNFKIRYLSGYRPGKTFNGSIASLGTSFLRDPADYVRPPQLRATGYSETITDTNGQTYTREVLPREARQRAELNALFQDNAARLEAGIVNFDEEISPITAPQLFSLLDEDPYDLYFDQAFRPTRIEQMRSEMEGRLVLPEWSKATNQEAFNTAINRGTADIRFDDLFLNLSMMVFGHFKQVQDLSVLKKIAVDLNIDLSDYNAEGLENRLATIEGTDVLTNDQFEALADINGIINVMYRQGIIKVLGGLTDEYWTTFPKIGGVDQLDVVEYEKYQIEYRNIFNVAEMTPYEPAGSNVYYQLDTLSKQYYSNLQTQAISQGNLDSIRRELSKKLEPTQTKIQSLEREISTLPPNLLEKINRLFGPDSDVQNILYDTKNTYGDRNAWVLWKQKNKGDLKEKGRKAAFFELIETEGQIIRDSLSKDAEDEIFAGIGAPEKPLWHINTGALFTRGRIMISRHGQATSKVLLLTKEMIDSMEDASTVYPIVDVTQARRYHKPSRQGSRDRIDRLMKNREYFRATVAQYIFEVILNPLEYQKDEDNNNVPQGYPENLGTYIGAPNVTDIVTLCEAVEKFIIQLREQLYDLKESLQDLDSLLINANDPAQLDKIKTDIELFEKLQGEFSTELFEGITALNAYIDDQHLKLLNTIIAQIEFVRKRVFDKSKEKYYISWLSSASQRVSKWKPSYDFKINQPSGT